MGQFVRGDVVIINVPFSDGSGAKHRPALVIARPSPDDLILCPITATIHGGEFRVQIDARDFVVGGISRPASEIKADFIFTADHTTVRERAGKLREGPVATVITKIKRLLDSQPPCTA